MNLDLIGYLLDRIFGIAIIMISLLSMDNNQDILIATELIIFTYIFTTHSKKKGEPA
jgi:hypothetical protein